MNNSVIPNQDPENGIHYGVIPVNDLGEWAWEDFINDGDDIDYDEYLAELRAVVAGAIERAGEDGQFKDDLAADYILELDYAEDLLIAISDSVLEQDQQDAFAAAEGVIDDEAGQYYEQGGDCTRYRYEKDGYIIQVCSDGDCFVIKSPWVTFCRPCSPCAPNAGYLKDVGGTLATYALGPEWFDEGDDKYAHKMPYKVIKTEDYLKGVKEAFNGHF